MNDGTWWNPAAHLWCIACGYRAQEGQLEAVRCLLDHNANVDAPWFEKRAVDVAKRWQLIETNGWILVFSQREFFFPFFPLMYELAGWKPNQRFSIFWILWWSSCFSLLRYMIFYFTEHVMGWGGVGIIPNRSVAPLHDLLAFLSYATWSSTSPNMLWGGVGWG